MEYGAHTMITDHRSRCRTSAACSLLMVAGVPGLPVFAEYFTDAGHFGGVVANTGIPGAVSGIAGRPGNHDIDFQYSW
jgi:hypothetical protein